ncbi:MAG: hypothetical protein AB9891_11000 [Anaerolineaceae bacterium]
MTTLSLPQLISLGSAAFGLVMLFVSLFQMSRETWLKPFQSIMMVFCYAFPTAVLLYASKASVNYILGAGFAGLGLLIGIFIGARIGLRGASGGIFGSRSRFPTFVWSLSSLATPLTALTGLPALFALGVMGILFGFGMVIASEGTLFLRLVFFKSPAPAGNASDSGVKPQTPAGPSGKRRGMVLAVIAALVVMCACVGIAAPSIFPDVLKLPSFLSNPESNETSSTDGQPAAQNVSQQQMNPVIPSLEPAEIDPTPEDKLPLPETVALPSALPAGNEPINETETPDWPVINGGENLAASAFWNQEGITAAAGTLTISTQNGYFMFINKEGQYLDLSEAKDFGVRAVIEVPEGGFGGISLYAALPKGEWWQGVKRLDVGLDKSGVVIAAWDGSGEGPVIWQEFEPQKPQTKMEVTVYKEGDLLDVFADGQKLVRVKLNGLLDADKVYFGVNVAPQTQTIIHSISVLAPGGQGVEVR